MLKYLTWHSFWMDIDFSVFEEALSNWLKVLGLGEDHMVL